MSDIKIKSCSANFIQESIESAANEATPRASQQVCIFEKSKQFQFLGLKFVCTKGTQIRFAPKLKSTSSGSEVTEAKIEFSRGACLSAYFFATSDDTSKSGYKFQSFEQSAIDTWCAKQTDPTIQAKCEKSSSAHEAFYQHSSPGEDNWPGHAIKMIRFDHISLSQRGSEIEAFARLVVSARASVFGIGKDNLEIGREIPGKVIIKVINGDPILQSLYAGAKSLFPTNDTIASIFTTFMSLITSTKPATQ